MNALANLTKTQVKDLAARALHTFWEAFVAVIGVTWAASGLDVSQVTDVAGAKRFGLAALGAVLAAVLSAAKSTLSALVYPAKHATTSTPAVSDAGAGSIDLVLLVVTLLAVLAFLKAFSILIH